MRLTDALSETLSEQRESSVMFHLFARRHHKSYRFFSLSNSCSVAFKFISILIGLPIEFVKTFDLYSNIKSR